MAVPGKKASKSSPSTQSMASDEDLQVYCQPCDEDGTRLPAHGFCINCEDHLCKDCFKFHKKNRLSKHHTLLDATSMPMSLQEHSATTQTNLPDQLTTPCPTHPKEMIKFYCYDHEELLCHVCVTLKHTSTPCKVNYIPDISGEIIDSVEYQVLLQTVNDFSDIYTEITRDVKEMTHKSNTSLKDVLADIKKFRLEINETLDEMEEQAKDAAKVIEQDNNNNLKIVERTCESTIKALQTLSDTIKQLNISKQADKLFLELKLVEKTMKDVNKEILLLISNDVNEYNFKRNEAILTKFKEETSLGTLTQKTFKKESTSTTQPVQIKSRQISHQGEISVLTVKDEFLCNIKGMTILTPELLIITDWYNKAIKMVDTSSHSVTDQLQLDCVTWDITTVTSTDLAVTLPRKQTIQFISVSSNKLTTKNTMKVAGECLGISCHQGKLVVSFHSPAKVQILAMNGTILVDIDGKNNFILPNYVKTNSSAIYLSDWEMKRVIRLNWLGEVVCTYGSMKFPFGLELSDDGTVFLCDRESNVIEEISGDCSTGKVVLKDLKYPQALCLCTKTSKLYLSCHNKNENDNFIQTYKVS